MSESSNVVDPVVDDVEPARESLSIPVPTESEIASRSSNTLASPSTTYSNSMTLRTDKSSYAIPAVFEFNHVKVSGRAHPSSRYDVNIINVRTNEKANTGVSQTVYTSPNGTFTSDSIRINTPHSYAITGRLTDAQPAVGTYRVELKPWSSNVAAPRPITFTVTNGSQKPISTTAPIDTTNTPTGALYGPDVVKNGIDTWFHVINPDQSKYLYQLELVERNSGATLAYMNDDVDRYDKDPHHSLGAFRRDFGGFKGGSLNDIVGNYRVLLHVQHSWLGSWTTLRSWDFDIVAQRPNVFLDNNWTNGAVASQFNLPLRNTPYAGRLNWLY